MGLLGGAIWVHMGDDDKTWIVIRNRFYNWPQKEDKKTNFISL